MPAAGGSEDISEQIADKAQQAADVVVSAGKTVGKAAKSAIDHAPEVGAAVANAAKSAAERAPEVGAAVVKAANVAAEYGEVAVKGIGDGLSKAYHSEEARAILGKGFGALEQAYTMSAEEARDAMKTASGLVAAGCASFHTMLKAEIVRDFTQVLASVMSQAYRDAKGALKAVAAFFGTIANFVVFNLGTALKSEGAAIFGFVVMVIATTAAIIAYFWLLCGSGMLTLLFSTTADQKLKRGKEASNFHEEATKKRDQIWYAEKIIFVCLSIYLPIATYIAQVVFCDTSSFIVQYAIKHGTYDLSQLSMSDDFKPSQICNALTSIQYLRVFSYYTMILFMIPLPLFLYKCVSYSIPSPNLKHPEYTFDADGEKVPFDDKTYNELVENDIDQNLKPFRSLYRGFERKYAQYKVGMLVWKCFIIFVSVAVNANAVTLDGTGKQVAAAVFLFIVLLFQAVAFWYMKPFIDENQDIMDASGRIAAAFSAFGGIFTSAQVANGGTNFLGVLVMLVNITNSLIMAYFTLMGNATVRLFLKNKTGRFTFTDSSKGLNDLTAIQALSLWDCHKEVKHRVWQAFWNGMLLKKCGPDVPGRLVQAQKDVVDNGLEAIEHHWAGERDVEIAKLRQHLRENCEGVDMYWDDATGTMDGHLDSSTNFGYLIVQHYPFEARLVYDDGGDITILSEDAKLLRFGALNSSPEIEAKRSIRKRLRVMDECGTVCNWPFSRMETHRVEDGFHYEEHKDSQGVVHKKKVIDYSNVSIEVFYTNGKISTGGIKHGAGFVAQMHYQDGTGSGIKPKTHEHFTLNNLSHTAPQSHFECDNSFTMSAGLLRLFTLGRADIERRLGPMLEEERKYRADTITKENNQNAILGDGFWYFVYNDPKLQRSSLERYLSYSESNPVLKEIPNVHAAGLDYLYKRISIIQLSHASAVWYTFWEDFWFQNKDMDVLKDKGSLFDPTVATSLPYRPLLRTDLEAELLKHNLMKDQSTLSTFETRCPIFVREHFNSAILDALYLKMDGKEVKYSVPGTEVVNPVSQPHV